MLDVSGPPKQVGEVKVGSRPWVFALTADGKFLYTANGPSNDVSVVDTATLKVIKTIPVGGSPWGVAVLAKARYTAPPGSFRLHARKASASTDLKFFAFACLRLYRRKMTARFAGQRRVTRVRGGFDELVVKTSHSAMRSTTHEH